jgi:hypothetical protein
MFEKLTSVLVGIKTWCIGCINIINDKNKIRYKILNKLNII